MEISAGVTVRLPHAHYLENNYGSGNEEMARKGLRTATVPCPAPTNEETMQKGFRTATVPGAVLTNEEMAKNGLQTVTSPGAVPTKSRLEANGIEHTLARLDCAPIPKFLADSTTFGHGGNS